MSAIISPAIVRRYLIAVGAPTDWNERHREARERGLSGSWRDFDAEHIARLGMLAAAEILYSDMAATAAEKGENYEDLDGHDAAIDDVIRHRIDRLIKAADVDPKAWAAARMK